MTSVGRRWMKCEVAICAVQCGRGSMQGTEAGGHGGDQLGWERAGPDLPRVDRLCGLALGNGRYSGRFLPCSVAMVMMYD
jgi:hypothetical protein